MKGFGGFVRSLASLLAVVGLVVGIPVALALLVGWPLPREVPTWGEVTTALEQQGISTDVLIKALAVVVWLAWVPLCWAFVTETWAAVQGRAAGRVVFAWPGAQRLARRLIASAALLLTSFAGLKPAGAVPLDPLVMAGAEAPAEAELPGDTYEADGDTTIDLSSLPDDARLSAPGFAGGAADSSGPAGSAGSFDAGGGPTGMGAPGGAAVATAPAAPPMEWEAEGGTTGSATPEVIHVAEQGETFWGLAERYLGSGLRWREVRDHNVGRTVAPGHVLGPNADHVEAGWQVLIPQDVPVDGGPADSGPAEGDGPTPGGGGPGAVDEPAEGQPGADGAGDDGRDRDGAVERDGDGDGPEEVDGFEEPTRPGGAGEPRDVDPGDTDPSGAEASTEGTTDSTGPDDADADASTTASVPVPGDADELPGGAAPGDEATKPVPTAAVVPPGIATLVPLGQQAGEDEMGQPSEVTAEAGDHFWSLAERQLSEAWGRDVTAAEIAPYWQQFVADNMGQLSSSDADVIYPGEQFTAPVPPSDPDPGAAASAPSDAPEADPDPGPDVDDDLDADLDAEPGPEPAGPGPEAEADTEAGATGQGDGPSAEPDEAAAPTPPSPPAPAVPTESTDPGPEPGADPEAGAETGEPDETGEAATEGTSGEAGASATDPAAPADPERDRADELNGVETSLADQIEDEEAAEEDDSSSGLPAVVPLGASAVLAGLLLVALRRRRFSRRRLLRPGQVIDPRDEEQVLLERGMAAGAQDIYPTVAAASRGYGSALAANPDLPAVTGMWVSPSRDVVMQLSEPAIPEVPFERGPLSDRWELYLDELDLDPEMGPGPDPATSVLDTPAVIGQDDEGDWVVIDLESVGALEIDGDDGVATDLVRSIVAELALQPQAERMVDITVVGVDGLASDVLEQGVVSFDRLDEDLVRRVERVAAETDSLQTHRGAAARAQGLPRDGLFVTVVALGGATTPDPALLERLSAAAMPGGRGIAVVAVGALGIGATRVLVNEEGDAHIPHMGVTVAASQVASDGLHKVEQLLADEPEVYPRADDRVAMPATWPEWPDSWPSEESSAIPGGWMGTWIPIGDELVDDPDAQVGDPVTGEPIAGGPGAGGAGRVGAGHLAGPGYETGVGEERSSVYDTGPGYGDSFAVGAVRDDDTALSFPDADSVAELDDNRPDLTPPDIPDLSIPDLSVPDSSVSDSSVSDSSLPDLDDTSLSIMDLAEPRVSDPDRSVRPPSRDTGSAIDAEHSPYSFEAPATPETEAPEEVPNTLHAVPPLQRPVEDVQDLRHVEDLRETEDVEDVDHSYDPAPAARRVEDEAPVEPLDSEADVADWPDSGYLTVAAPPDLESPAEAGPGRQPESELDGSYGESSLSLPPLYESPPWELCIRVFADHQVETADGEQVSFRYGHNPDVPNKNTHRGPELLAYLALSGRTATAEEVRDHLWWDRPIALGTVNKLIYGTRKVVGGAEVLSHAQEDPLGRYRLASNIVTDAQLLIDALEYAKTVANRHPGAAVDALGPHLAAIETVAFRNRYLGQGLMEWASAYRVIDSVELPVIEAALLYGRLSCESGRQGYHQALWGIDQGLRACPYNEALVRVAMEIEALLGNAEAVNHRYLTLATRLARDELEPEPETSELRVRLGGSTRLRSAG